MLEDYQPAQYSFALVTNTSKAKVLRFAESNISKQQPLSHLSGFLALEVNCRRFLVEKISSYYTSHHPYKTSSLTSNKMETEGDYKKTDDVL